MWSLDARRCADYAKNDWVSALQARLRESGDDRFVSHRWLRESLPKRMAYAAVYGDLVGEDSTRRSILDVGGGYGAITRRLLSLHDYRLVEIAAHDAETLLRQEERRLGVEFFDHKDWLDLDAGEEYDLVIANDLFPNVDQRLDIFIARLLPRCHEMRLLLTYYDNGRWYKVKRIDADEILHVMAWDGQQVARVLERYEGRLSGDLDALRTPHSSAFPNGRQVCLVTVRGHL